MSFVLMRGLWCQSTCLTSASLLLWLHFVTVTNTPFYICRLAVLWDDKLLPLNRPSCVEDAYVEVWLRVPLQVGTRGQWTPVVQ